MATRYPDALDSALPTTAFHGDEAERAIAYAHDVSDVADEHLPR